MRMSAVAENTKKIATDVCAGEGQANAALSKFAGLLLPLFCACCENSCHLSQTLLFIGLWQLLRMLFFRLLLFIQLIFSHKLDSKMCVNDENESHSRQSTSWAGIVGKGSPPQQQVGAVRRSWTVIKTHFFSAAKQW